MRMLCFCLLILLAGCESREVLPPPAWLSPEGREHADLGQIRDLRTGRRLSPAQLVEALAVAPWVLVGEQHDNPDHHALQLWLLRSLAQRRPSGSLLLEMLGPDQQARVERAQEATRQGLPPRDLIGALAWQPGWDWSLYGPLLRYALAQPYPLLAANLSRPQMMQVYRRPPTLQGRLSMVKAVQDALLADIRQSHCGLLPEAQLPAMLAVQQQRDRRMAEALLAAPAPAVLLAGAFHVRRDLGVPLHLADLGARPGLVLMLAEVGATVTAAQADFVWYSAAQPEQDHCAVLR